MSKEEHIIAELIGLSTEALFLAMEYSGGESETAKALTKRLKKLVDKWVEGGSK